MPFDILLWIKAAVDLEKNAQPLEDKCLCKDRCARRAVERAALLPHTGEQVRIAFPGESRCAVSGDSNHFAAIALDSGNCRFHFRRFPAV